MIVLVSAGAGGAAVAAVPAAITGPVTSVGPTTATVTGTVNPGGQATTWYVEYGTSTSYGAKTSNVSAGSGTANTAVSANLTGLTPGTTYHYRVVATNGVRHELEAPTESSPRPRRRSRSPVRRRASR